MDDDNMALKRSAVSVTLADEETGALEDDTIPQS